MVDSNVPNFEDTILSYLKGQEAWPEDNFEVKHDEDAEENVQELMQDLLSKVNKRIACKDRYENLKLSHNQFPLFDMNDYFADFCMDEELMRKLSFRETLLIGELESTTGGLPAQPTTVGGLCLLVETVDCRTPTEAAVDVDGEICRAYRKAKRGSFDQADGRLRALPTRYFTDKEGIYREKSLYVALQKGRYYLRSTSSPPDLQERKYYGLGKTHDLVGEGASFVLMRYLAITGYKGRLELSTTYINGDMCRNIYECTGPMPGSVNDKPVEVCKIYRSVIEECGIEHHCATTLTLHGQIIAQEWEGCDFVLLINPMQRLTDHPSPYERMALDKTWMDDLELLSQYLDCKTKAELEMKTYTADHSEIRDILADYLNNVLLLKPENILAFTMEFFESLCPVSMAQMGHEEEVDKSTEFYRMRGSSDEDYYK